MIAAPLDSPDPTTPKGRAELHRELAACYPRLTEAPRTDAALWAAVSALFTPDSRILVYDAGPMTDAEDFLRHVDPECISKVIRVHGQQEIILKNGSRIVFPTKRLGKYGANWLLILGVDDFLSADAKRLDELNEPGPIEFTFQYSGRSQRGPKVTYWGETGFFG